MKEKHHIDSKDQQLSLYPTALVEGTATAMKLQTYVNFPVRDPVLDSYLGVDI